MREHSRAELLKKIKEKGLYFNHVSDVLGALAEQGLQSDLRFAHSFLSSRAKAGFGPVRIRQELLSKGVEGKVVGGVFNECGVDWFKNARLAFKKKFPNPSGDLQERAKRVRFLTYRGFQIDHIKKIVGEFDNE